MGIYNPCHYRNRFLGISLARFQFCMEDNILNLFDRFIDLLSDPPFKFVIIAAVVIWIVGIVMWRVYGN